MFTPTHRYTPPATDPSCSHPHTPPATGPGADVIEGLDTALARTRGTPCCVCGIAAGATLKCSFGHCAAILHPLCVRRKGWYLAIRQVGGGGNKLQYRLYCGSHSEGMRVRDWEVAQARAAGVSGGRRVGCAVGWRGWLEEQLWHGGEEKQGRRSDEGGGQGEGLPTNKYPGVFLAPKLHTTCTLAVRP